MASYLDPTTQVSYEQPWASGMRRGYLESVANLAGQPTPVPVQQVAGLDPYEMRAREMAGGLGGFTPYLQQGSNMMQQGYGAMQQGRGALGGAQGMYGQGAGLVGQGAGMYGHGAAMTGRAADMYAPGAAQQFYNPYEQDVVQQTMQDMREANQQQGITDRAGAVSQGAFGGSRGRLMEQERERSFGRGMMEGIGGIRSKGFGQAMRGAQTAAQGLGGMGQMFGNLGMRGQQGLMNQINAFNRMGGVGRGIQGDMYGAQFDAAQRMADEPWQRMNRWQNMLSMLPQTMSETTWGQPKSSFDPYGALAGIFGTRLPGWM